MKKIGHIFFLFCLLVLAESKGFCQNGNADNLLKISKSFLEYQLKKTKYNKNSDILFVNVKNQSANEYSFGIWFDNIYYLVGKQYHKIYEFNKFKLIISENSDKISMLDTIFQEIPYEDVNKGKREIRREPIGWSINLNENNEVLSMSSKYANKDVLKIFKKNKVKFSENFRVISAYPGKK